MFGKSEQHAAREAVAAYHGARLSDLLARVGTAIDQFRIGEAFEVDRALFQYSRAAKELWKFCNAPNVEATTQFIRERPPIDWWQRGEPRRRRGGPA